MKKIAIFIPGRTASQRLVNKLLLPIGDSTLWNEACKKLAQLPDKYEKIAYCNDIHLIKIAESNGINVVKRSKYSCEIDGPNTEIFHGLREIDATHLVYFHPCFAFVSVDRFIEALEKFENDDDIQYMTSVIPFKNWLYKGKKNIIDIDKSSWSTKTVENYWLPSHNFQMFNKDEFFDTGKILPDGHSIFEMTEKDAIDVNTHEEFQYVKWRFENENNS